MSEATTPNEQEPIAPDVPAGKPATAPNQPAPRGNALAALALLLGAGGVAVGAWGVWQVRDIQLREQQQLAQLQQTSAQTDALVAQTRELNSRLEELPPAAELAGQRRLLSQLQGDQQLLNQRLESLLGASRQDWRLAEAEHLLRLASLRLSALQDIHSALALVEGADEILRSQDDPAAFAAREQLANSLEALRTTVDPDRTGLFLQLGALRDQAAQLQALPPSFAAAGEGGALSELAAAGEPSSWWVRGLEALSQYVRLDFDAQQNIRPLLAGQGLTQVRLTLSLAFEQAQWAALHGHTAVYRQALRQARDILGGHFNAENPDSRALAARIDELLERPIEVQVPDLSGSLNAVQAYIASKQSARVQFDSAVEAESAEQEPRP
ncbi:uroporphyrinogen-III C-methyltransferase [Pseudomonas sp.]|uniref:uroporphyrinogen-III C-methyltransferase n=1 Tax=Pseudomonas sp. TaxID=306 RepID=UPI002735C059|nr:uroporphyrinogen-III C-methyltransferase [Pseudomonas sp.]MDP3814555.1 uroporphyrinogen-III C-methyltransferase [Pseudomonas sp.]